MTSKYLLSTYPQFLKQKQRQYNIMDPGLIHELVQCEFLSFDRNRFISQLELTKFQDLIFFDKEDLSKKAS